MWPKIKLFLIGLLYENGQPSLTRCIIGTAFLVFVAGTIADIIIALCGHSWPSYQTFATITGGGAMAAKVGDKVTNTIVNSVYNSPKGEMPKGGNQ